MYHTVIMSVEAARERGGIIYVATDTRNVELWTILYPVSNPTSLQFLKVFPLPLWINDDMFIS